MAPADGGNDPCVPGLVANPRCPQIVVEGDPPVDQNVYVVLSGVESVTALEFGITYGPDDLYVDGWFPCLPGYLAINDPAWPDSGSGAAFVWDPVYPSNSDGIVVVGYLRVLAGSAGVIALVPDPRSGTAEYVNDEDETHVFDLLALGRADVAGTGFGINTCGHEVDVQLPPLPPIEDPGVPPGALGFDPPCGGTQQQLWYENPGFHTSGRNFQFAVEAIDDEHFVVMRVTQVSSNRSRYTAEIYPIDNLGGGLPVQAPDGFAFVELWETDLQIVSNDFVRGKHRLFASDGDGLAFFAGDVAHPYENEVTTRTVCVDDEASIVWQEDFPGTEKVKPIAVRVSGAYVTTVSAVLNAASYVAIEQRWKSNGDMAEDYPVYLDPPVTPYIVVDAAVDAGGNTFVLAGGPSNVPWLTKVSPAGFQEWDVQFPLTDAVPSDVLVDPSQMFVYATGFAQNPDNGTLDAFMAVATATGDSVRANLYDAYEAEQADPDPGSMWHFPDGDEIVFGAAVTQDHYVYLVGYLRYSGGFQYEMAIRLNGLTGEPDFTSPYNWTNGGCFRALEYGGALLACEVDRHNALIATGYDYSEQHESTVIRARRRSQAPGSPAEPSWGEWVFDRNGFQDSHELSDVGLDIAYMTRPEGGVDEYWFCDVGWSGLDESNPPYTHGAMTYMRVFSMCDVPVPVPEGALTATRPLHVRSGSRLRLVLPDFTGAANLAVYDVMGRRVLYRAVTPTAGRVELAPRASGVYFVDLRATSGRWTGKGVVLR